MLSPEQQLEWLHSDPKAFVPAKGAWGRRGCTQVRLQSVKASTLRQALTAAWRHKAPDDLVAGL